jgi:DNA topoisomerase I
MAKTKNGTCLVVVESPAKARTISKYLGSGYRVKASVGHIRDLPERELGVDVEHGFEPRYVTIRGKGKVIQDLRRDAEGVDEIVLATDPDREGEAIAYHVAEQLGFQPGTGQRFRRVLFHEVTRDAIRRALEEPGEIDMRKVEAQQARRILDRLVGYQVSPLLWKPIRPGLSAGRVQTVALRLITEREVEIRAFEPQEYWSITARLEKDRKEFEARLHQIGGKAFRLENEAEAGAVLRDIEGLPFVVTELKRRERLKNPPPPFTTSTLQQEAAKRLGFTAQRTMRTAQQLYEGVDLGAEGATGLITYMRTDSTRVAGSAIDAARALVLDTFGDPYLPDKPRSFGGKQKAAQDAHEAIRPTDAMRRPEHVRRHLDRDQYRMYELIWLRFVAGQMASAVFDTTTVDFLLRPDSGTEYLFRATGSIMKFDGFTRLYQEAREEGDHRTLDDLTPLPNVENGDRCRLEEIVPAQHFTQPPPRFTEASLVKELERLGIGRPSTYAAIISTLTDREYAKLEQKRFHPTPLGETVATVLVGVFPDLFNVDFTSDMELQLDRIEEGEIDWRKLLENFYSPFQRQLADGASKSERIVRETVASDAGNCPECNRELLVRWNRYGRFLGCAGYPECRYTQSIDGREKAEPVPTGESCPNCASPLVEREGRFGPFIACSNYPTCKHTKPKTIPGLICPQCGEGEVGEKRTRRGKPFWGCVRYPDCDWSTWDEPVAKPCPACDSTFLVRKSTKARGEFLKCPTCKSEYTQDEGGAVEAAASGMRTPAQRRSGGGSPPGNGNGKAFARRRTAARRPASKSAAKAGANQAGAKKAGAKKAGAKKAGAKQAGAKQAGATKAGARKAGARKAGANEAGANEAGAKKAPPRKAAKKASTAKRSRPPEND